MSLVLSVVHMVNLTKNCQREKKQFQKFEGINNKNGNMELNSSGHWILIYLGTVTKFYSRSCSVGEGRKQLGVLND